VLGVPLFIHFRIGWGCKALTEIIDFLSELQGCFPRQVGPSTDDFDEEDKTRKLPIAPLSRGCSKNRTCIHRNALILNRNLIYEVKHMRGKETSPNTGGEEEARIHLYEEVRTTISLEQLQGCDLVQMVGRRCADNKMMAQGS
jgi:hypothetical protein